MPTYLDYLLMVMAAPFHALSTNHPPPQNAVVEHLYQPTTFLPPAVDGLPGYLDIFDEDEGFVDSNDREPKTTGRKLLSNTRAVRKLVSETRIAEQAMPRVGPADSVYIHPVMTISGPNDKKDAALTHRGDAFNPVGCAYVGRPCNAFYYPYSTFDKSHDSSKVRIYDGYQQPYKPVQKDKTDKQVEEDKTDYNWNIMASFPYIAKSPLFGSRNLHGFVFDDFENTPAIFSGKVVKVIIYGNTRVTSIKFVYEGGKFVSHGKQQDEAWSSIDLAKDEHIVQGKFSNCKVRKVGKRHTRLCGASFTTNKGQEVARGRFSKDVRTTMAPKNFVVAGLFGREGANIDQLGLVAVDFDAVKALNQKNPMPAFDGQVWSKTQFPGIGASLVYGRKPAPRYNEAYRFPYDIMQVKLNKVSLYKDDDLLCGMTFSYDGAIEIDVGTRNGEPAIVDLSSGGRIEEIAIGLYSNAGVTVVYTDKDGNRQAVTQGRIDDSYEPQHFVIPEGTELIAPLGAQSIIDGVGRFRKWGWVVRKSQP